MIIVMGLLATGLWQGLIRLQPVAKHPLLASAWRKWGLLGVLIGGSVILYTVGFAQAYYEVLPTAVLQANLVFVLAWELLGSLLLLIPRLQGPIVLLCWAMHSVIAMIGFVDFSALAGALLFTFVPASYVQVLAAQPTLALGNRTIHRVRLYYGINVIAGLFSALFFLLGVFFEVRVLGGILFNLAATLFLWPILVVLWGPDRRPPWQGIPMVHRTIPKVMGLCLLVLCLYGVTPYLGLRTAGNFSMFSNLRTEGDRSNHLLLGSNPLKLWEYQEDVVKLLKVDDGVLFLDPRNIELEGGLLPMVEFRKLIYQWTQAGYTVPLTFQYQGQTYTTPDIVTDSRWQTHHRTWEMILMDFRVIQPPEAGPNLCRW